MKKEDFIQKKVENILLSVSFTTKFEGIAREHPGDGELSILPESLLIQECFANGIKIRYSKIRGYYLEEIAGDLRSTFGFTIKYNSFDFGMSFTDEKLGIATSAPWHFLVTLLKGEDIAVRRIMYCDLRDAVSAIGKCYNLFSEVKEKLLRLS